MKKLIVVVALSLMGAAAFGHDKQPGHLHDASQPWVSVSTEAKTAGAMESTGCPDAYDVLSDADGKIIGCIKKDRSAEENAKLHEKFKEAGERELDKQLGFRPAKIVEKKKHEPGSDQMLFRGKGNKLLFAVTHEGELRFRRGVSPNAAALEFAGFLRRNWKALVCECEKKCADLKPLVIDLGEYGVGVPLPEEKP